MSIAPNKIEISTSNTIGEDFSVEAERKAIVKSSTISASAFDCIFDDSVSSSSIPLFMKYFAFHEILVLICGGIYYLTADVGVLCLSIIPGLSIIGIFLHFLLTQFNRKNLQISSTFFSIKHYSVSLSIFLIALSSIIAIYHVNTYLSYLVPNNPHSVSSSATHSFIDGILRFPYKYATRKSVEEDMSNNNSFNYRISFVGSIIAPIIEESSKYLLISLTFPIRFIWSFCRDRNYKTYCIKSLFIMFIGLCGGCGIAIMENIGYLAACQWNNTQEYCLPNRNFDILGAGLARGIFSVPFHCVTACIMADVLCMWMNTNIACFQKHRILYIFKFILSYPIAIFIPVFLHSSFNYWMKGIPIMTGIITIAGFSFVSSRMAKKYSVITNKERKSKKSEDDIEILQNNGRISTDSFDITIAEPPIPL